MAAMNEDSATGDGAGGIIRSVKYYCDKAVENLKAGRLNETYLYVNEALELDGKDAKVAALYRYALYTLYPKKRLLDKAETLCEEADRCKKEGDGDKALELLSVAKKWHCTPGILYARASTYFPLKCLDLAYVDMTEGLAQCKENGGFLAMGQQDCLSLLGYKVLPVLKRDPASRRDEMPARYHVKNWPKGLRIERMFVHFTEGYAEAMKTGHTPLKPRIPLNQLAPFLNHNVQGAMQSLTFIGKDRPECVLLLRLLDEVTVPGRLHVYTLNFIYLFLSPWTSIERILDGRALRANAVNCYCLEMPSGVDPNELLKLPTIRECILLRIWLYNRFAPQHSRRPPLFNNAALLEWIKRGDGRVLQLTREYLSSGLLSFLDALKKDFGQATQVHSYDVRIQCPHMDVVAGLGVRNEELSNRLGEKMRIGVGQDTIADAFMQHRFETVFVVRLRC